MKVNIWYDRLNSLMQDTVSCNFFKSHTVPVEAWRYPGERGVDLLTRVFNTSWERERMPEEWRRSVLIPVFKNKADVQRDKADEPYTEAERERVVEAC